MTHEDVKRAHVMVLRYEALRQLKEEYEQLTGGYPVQIEGKPSITITATGIARMLEQEMNVIASALSMMGVRLREGDSK